jgi:bifunctional dethiobiotin synthetase / adenosylmethionine---8-amino-7-oxononanoate aminotransferase
LRLPIVLVADGKYGGISSTLSAYEALRTRGYTVHAIVMIMKDEKDSLGNSLAIQRHLDTCYRTIPGDLQAEAGKSPSWSMQTAPKVFCLSPMPTDRQSLLHGWFQQNEPTFGEILQWVESSISESWHHYETMIREGANYVWWPFTDHDKVAPNDISFIESAHGDHYRLFSLDLPKVTKGSSSTSDGTIKQAEYRKPKYVSTFDGSASWWTQAIGHGDSLMSIAIAEAAGRYGHVLFPRNLHPPVVQLSRYLIERGPGKGWAQRVFFSDNGSSAMEIALKMACRLSEYRRFQSTKQANSQDGESRLMVLSQQGGYHGDTLGAMNTVEHSPFNHQQHPWYKCEAFALPTPYFAVCNGRLKLDVVHLLDTDLNTLCEDLTFQDMDELIDVKTRMDSKLAKEYRRFVIQSLNKIDITQVTTITIILSINCQYLL